MKPESIVSVLVAVVSLATAIVQTGRKDEERARGVACGQSIVALANRIAEAGGE